MRRSEQVCTTHAIAIAVALALLVATGCGQEPAPVAPGPGPYFGQQPPGDTPVVFAPGIVSTGARELNSVFSPDGRWFVFSRVDDDVPKMYFSEYRDGSWTEPAKRELIPAHPDKIEVDMSFAPDGQRLYFLSDAPTGTFPDESWNIWVSRLEGDRWLPAEPLPAPLNSAGRDLYPTIVADGSMYFSSNRDGGFGEGDSWRAQYRDGAFEEPVNLGPAINGPASEGDIYVSPDETWLVTTSSREGGAGRSDLWISFRTADGGWTDLVHMDGPFSTEESDYCPVATPDGKYFFFTQGGDVMWVDATALERFR